MVIPRMVATSGKRCPVGMFEEFISRPPSEATKAHGLENFGSTYKLR